MTWLALAVALVALIAALLARAKAGGQAALVEDAARDARRRLEALKEELTARQDNLRQMVAELAAGTELTRQQVLDGMLWSEIGPDEGRALVAAGGVRVLDVRTPAETAGGVIPGAVLIPIEELERRFRELPSSGRAHARLLRGRRALGRSLRVPLRQGLLELDEPDRRHVVLGGTRRAAGCAREIARLGYLPDPHEPRGPPPGARARPALRDRLRPLGRASACSRCARPAAGKPTCWPTSAIKPPTACSRA